MSNSNYIQNLLESLICTSIKILLNVIWKTILLQRQNHSLPEMTLHFQSYLQPGFVVSILVKEYNLISTECYYCLLFFSYISGICHCAKIRIFTIYQILIIYCFCRLHNSRNNYCNHILVWHLTIKILLSMCNKYLFLRFVLNKYFRPKNEAQDVEWGYSFDVHLNAFFPPLILLHFFQLFFYNGKLLHSIPCNFNECNNVLFFRFNKPRLVYFKTTWQYILAGCSFVLHVHYFPRLQFIKYSTKDTFNNYSIAIGDHILYCVTGFRIQHNSCPHEFL